jgi:hypothetical protein
MDANRREFMETIAEPRSLMTNEWGQSNDPVDIPPLVGNPREARIHWRPLASIRG